MTCKICKPSIENAYTDQIRSTALQQGLGAVGQLGAGAFGRFGLTKRGVTPWNAEVTSQLSQHFLSRLRIIRQVPAAGLIRSKQKGADAAKGDASRRQPTDCRL